MSRIASTLPPGSAPFMTRSPVMSTTSGFSRFTAFRTASSAPALPCTSDSTAMRVLTLVAPRTAAQSSQDALRRNQEAEGRLAGDLAIHARDAPTAAHPRAELLHRDLEAQHVSRHDDPLEARVVDRGEEADAVTEPGLFRDVHGHG